MKEEIAYSTFDSFLNTLKHFISPHTKKNSMTFSCWINHKDGELLEVRAAFKKIKNGEMRFVNYCWDSDLNYIMDYKVVYNCMLHANMATEDALWNKEMCGKVNDESGFNLLIAMPDISYWCNGYKGQ